MTLGTSRLKYTQKESLSSTSRTTENLIKIYQKYESVATKRVIGKLSRRA